MLLAIGILSFSFRLHPSSAGDQSKSELPWIKYSSINRLGRDVGILLIPSKWSDMGLFDLNWVIFWVERRNSLQTWIICRMHISSSSFFLGFPTAFLYLTLFAFVIVYLFNDIQRSTKNPTFFLVSFQIWDRILPIEG